MILSDEQITRIRQDVEQHLQNNRSLHPTSLSPETLRDVLDTLDSRPVPREYGSYRIDPESFAAKHMRIIDVGPQGLFENAQPLQAIHKIESEETDEETFGDSISASLDKISEVVGYTGIPQPDEPAREPEVAGIPESSGEGTGKGYLTCEDCGKTDETVRETTCPYDEGVNGIVTDIVCCDDCVAERADDI